MLKVKIKRVVGLCDFVLVKRGKLLYIESFFFFSCANKSLCKAKILDFFKYLRLSFLKEMEEEVIK